MNYYLGLDVGGTNIKSGIISEDGKLLFDRIFTYKSQSDKSKEIILKNFTDIFCDLVDSIDDADKKIQAIGLAFPGPFDYSEGISYIKDIGKFDSIYNINLREAFLLSIRNHEKLSRFVSKDLKIIFLHDVAAFALGEIFAGRERGNKRVIHLCIGTGAGSAFSVEGELVSQGEGVPDNGWIYNRPFKDGIIDDYVSARGLKSVSQGYFSKGLDGRGLYMKALEQDENALSAFRHFGDDLFHAFIPFIKEFDADCIILGGEITQSFKFFGSKLEEFCRQEGVDIRLTHNTSKSTLLGLYKTLKTSA